MKRPQTFFGGCHTADVASGEYKKVVNGVKSAMENRARKECASWNVASTVMSSRTNFRSRGNHNNGGYHRGSSHNSS